MADGNKKLDELVSVFPDKPEQELRAALKAAGNDVSQAVENLLNAKSGKSKKRGREDEAAEPPSDGDDGDDSEQEGDGNNAGRHDHDSDDDSDDDSEEDEEAGSDDDRVELDSEDADGMENELKELLEDQEEEAVDPDGILKPPEPKRRKPAN